MNHEILLLVAKVFVDRLGFSFRLVLSESGVTYLLNNKAGSGIVVLVPGLTGVG